MNKYHREILEEIKKVSGLNPPRNGKFDLNRYLGTTHKIYNISNPQTWAILRNWVKNHKDISREELLELLDSTFSGESFTERMVGGRLLQHYPKLRAQVDPKFLDKWLTGSEGWAEVDLLCQTTFKACDLLDNWDNWGVLLNEFSEDQDIHKRRASLVLLVKPVRESDDSGLSNLAFENIEKLKGERDVLITKAISWLLRDLIKHHKERVKEYVENNLSTLPKIAIREVTIKLLTGKKNG